MDTDKDYHRGWHIVAWANFGGVSTTRMTAKGRTDNNEDSHFMNIRGVIIIPNIIGLRNVIRKPPPVLN